MRVDADATHVARWFDRKFSKSHFAEATEARTGPTSLGDLATQAAAFSILVWSDLGEYAVGLARGERHWEVFLDTDGWRAVGVGAERAHVGPSKWLGPPQMDADAIITKSMHAAGVYV